MVKVTAEAVPVAGILPVPDQPEQTYCVVLSTVTGDATNPETLEPLSYQPSTGEGVP